MKHDRLFQLLYLLLEHQSMTASDLSRALEVSVRTVYRDVESLSMAGVPIFALPGKGGGISLQPGYTFDKALLSDEEQHQLLFAIQSLKAVDQKVEPLLQKMGSAFQKAPRNWIEVDFSRWGMAKTDTVRFECLKTAILGQKVGILTYCSTSGEISQRTIHPLKLIYKDKAWYLQAYCLRAMDFRLFKLGRILEFLVTEERFSEDYEEDIPPVEGPIPPAFTVHLTLRFAQRLAFRVYDEFERSSITPQSDGRFLVEQDVPINGWVLWYLLSFGTDVEILEPADLRLEVWQYAKKIAEHHKP